MTPDKARAIRKSEAEEAAEVLGAGIVFLDGSDYMLRVDQDMLYRTAGILRETQPEFILTHPAADPTNLDHVTAYNFALEARMVAQAHGHVGGQIIGAPQTIRLNPTNPSCAGSSLTPSLRSPACGTPSSRRCNVSRDKRRFGPITRMSRSNVARWPVADGRKKLKARFMPKRSSACFPPPSSG